MNNADTINVCTACVGSVQHLKNRFGDGYSLEIHSSQHHIDAIQSYIQSHFAGAELLEMHFGHLKYQLPKNELTLAEVFAILENVKAQYEIRDYAVSQTSLESIFVSVAQKSAAEIEDEEVSMQ